ncbi:hypothetical protein [Dyella caseinilytica]|uniref:DUF4013 domain-containing protein n=1 Tax=Dyella caseinilytica TaxID=1849581 RepID=A0ABX7GXR3_9GAMM|nr:hypothetical protein [Dyella caseinilytica]QRN54766.1 hypothetical protein ISN74_05265 [Dyella caseinilytica]GFZ96693.1 hypothetical protein GCM10011408_16400 [Dyella caseinilytica]
MATRSRGPSAGFGWLNRGISVGFRYPKPIFSGAILVMLAVLIPTLITLALEFYALHGGTPPQPTAFVWISAVSALLGLLILPIYAGYLRVIDAVEQELPVRASDVVKPYREGKALRLIGYGVVMMVVYFAMFAIVIAMTGGDTAHWYAQALTARANHQPPPTSLPDGFGITLLLCGVIGIFMMGFYSIGLGQVTLSNRSVFGAIGDGIVGALKNLLPLLMLALGSILIWIAVALCFGIVVFLLALIGKLIGPWLVLVLAIPLYIALILVTFTAMFGVMYHLWRDVCGDDIMTGTAETVAA